MDDLVQTMQSAGNLEWKPNILHLILSSVCFALTGRFNVSFFFPFNDVGSGINTRKLPRTLEIDRKINVSRPSLKQLMKISSQGQILLLS